MREVYGVGVNDATYAVSRKVSGKRKLCPIYATWVGMLSRCYCVAFQQRSPSYVGCGVDKRWYKFTEFRAWVLTQDWEGKQLDKDLLCHGNRTYGPDTCLFVDVVVNNFFNLMNKKRGDLPLGVTRDRGKYKAACARLTKGSQTIGRFDTPDEAHEVYLDYKWSLALELASQQEDRRVADAIIQKAILLLGERSKIPQ